MAAPSLLGRTLRLRQALAAALVALVGACLPTRKEGDLTTNIEHEQDAAPPDDTIVTQGGSAGAAGSPSVEPHAVTNVDPSHGKFIGGERVVVQGNGFAGKLRVWFGEREVAAKDVVAISTKKVQIIVPPGEPGDVSVAVQNGDDTSTRRALDAGYTYDPFYAEPAESPTTGGTLVTLHGAGTAWGEGTTVKIGDKPCADVVVQSPELLTCTAPAAAAGARPITVSGDGAARTVLDAFLYTDSDNGYKGGLSGALLPEKSAGGPGGRLRVVALDNYTGDPLAGASVYLDDNATPAATIDSAGVAFIDGVFAGVSVTVAQKCKQPASFVAVPTEDVTMFIDPVITPSCIPPEGEIPPTGGKPAVPARVQGSVVFPLDAELKPAPWKNIPKPQSPTARRVIYLFSAGTDPKAQFKAPAASQIIAEGSDPSAALPFLFAAPIGNVSLYAIAGIEDTAGGSTKFTAFGFGLLRGISTQSGITTSDVTVMIDTTLDQAVTLELDPPSPGKAGPDRVQASVALSMGNAGYAILPNAQRSQLLPLSSGEMTFIGLPPLTGSLEGFSYVSTAQAGTGPNMGLPVSVVGRYVTTSASTKVPIDAFVRVPELTSPSAVWDGSSFAVNFAPGGAPSDVLVIDVSSGGGLSHWFIAAPANMTKFRLPDLRTKPGQGLVLGPLTVTVSAGEVPNFKYKDLRYKHLTTTGWSAYARDAFFAQLNP